MKRFFIKRILYSVPLLIIMTFLSFSIMKLAPGDPAAIFMDPSMNVQDLEQIRVNLGFDKPIVVQYALWLKNVVSGNFGYSFVTGKPVLTSIVERLPATLLLSVTSLILILIITCPLGLITGAKKNSILDYIVTVVSFVGMSIPSFWLGLMLILLFGLTLGITPTSGFLDPNLSQASFFVKAGNIIWHMILPLLTIVIGGTAGLIRYNRFGIINILNMDYIKAARARGISEASILFKHGFKNAALPLVTLLGLDLPSLIGGSFIIEFIFAWPGMGQLGVNAVFSRDYPILMGTLLFSSILIITGNILADFMYAKIDPRISH